jgi:hopanoid-associated phosphorylase
MPDRARLLIVSGLKREAAIFAGPGVTVICGDAATLQAKLAGLASAPLDIVVSAGICGGLDPGLRQGCLVIGSEVVAEGERIATDGALLEALKHRLELGGERPFVGNIAAADAPVLTGNAKAKLKAATGAVVVDMESLIAGRFARERALPFAILRAVSDPADRDLPPLVLTAVSPDGGVNIAAVLAALIRRPDQLPTLLAAAHDSKAGLRALRRCGALAGLLDGLGGTHF